MNIKVFSTPTCPYCVQLKEFLSKHELKYDDIDVSKDLAAAQEMIDKSGQMAVPVAEIDGQIVIGFNKPKIMEILGMGE
ncbi:MAG: glutaredoxin domain-containing protein [Patescibacteria group bacterium]|nr:glutaredoxin domain-containing protein [Patescibacteria group bacterium]